jgi:hypothetical protein
MAILTVAIGMILVYLILSLVSSAIQESIASWLSLRGKYMWEALENMLEEKQNDDDTGKYSNLLAEFKNHNLYMSLCAGKKKNLHPSYMKKKTFSKILVRILNGDDTKMAMSAVEKIPPGRVQTGLMQTLKKADGNIEEFRKELEEWYDEAMDRASGRYKRMAHSSLVIIGMLIAIAFNGDSLSIYEKMTLAASSPEQTQQIIGLADDLLDSRSDSAFTAQIQRVRTARLNLEGNVDSTLTLNLDSILASQNRVLKQQTLDLVNTYVSSNSALGLGWTGTDLPKFKENELPWLGFWLFKLVGFFITAMAVSLGASFWFDLLKKITNIRNAGPKTGEGEPAANPAPAANQVTK